MPRCIAFKAVDGKVVRCNSLVISNESIVCNNAHCQSMGVRIWLADSVVAMTLFTYLCEGGVFTIKYDNDGGEGLSPLDVTCINNKLDVAMFVTQSGGGINSIMGLMEQRLHCCIPKASLLMLSVMLWCRSYSFPMTPQTWWSR
jgi:hypothetical protein